MTDAPANLRAALEAMGDIAAAEATIRAARARRDAALRALHADDGWPVCSIVRDTGMSKSNVRLIVDLRCRP
jgi:hypothetical protein